MYFVSIPNEYRLNSTSLLSPIHHNSISFLIYQLIDGVDNCIKFTISNWVGFFFSKIDKIISRAVSWLIIWIMNFSFFQIILLGNNICASSVFQIKFYLVFQSHSGDIVLFLWSGLVFLIWHMTARILIYMFQNSGAVSS